VSKNIPPGRKVAGLYKSCRPVKNLRVSKNIPPGRIQVRKKSCRPSSRKKVAGSQERLQAPIDNILLKLVSHSHHFFDFSPYWHVPSPAAVKSNEFNRAYIIGHNTAIAWATSERDPLPRKRRTHTRSQGAEPSRFKRVFIVMKSKERGLSPGSTDWSHGSADYGLESWKHRLRTGVMGAQTTDWSHGSADYGLESWKRRLRTGRGGTTQAESRLSIHTRRLRMQYFVPTLTSVRACLVVFSYFHRVDRSKPSRSPDPLTSLAGSDVVHDWNRHIRHSPPTPSSLPCLPLRPLHSPPTDRVAPPVPFLWLAELHAAILLWYSLKEGSDLMFIQGL